MSQTATAEDLAKRVVTDGIEQALASPPKPASSSSDDPQPAPATPSAAAAASAAEASSSPNGTPNGSASKPKVKKSGSFLSRLFHRHSKAEISGSGEAQPKFTLTDARTVKLVKKNGSSLGMKVKSNDDNEQVFVSELTAGGLAEQDGNIRVGDIIVSINGEDMTRATHDAVVEAIKKNDEVVLVLAKELVPAKQSLAEVVDAVVEAARPTSVAAVNSPGSATSIRSETASPAGGVAPTGVPIDTRVVSIIKGGNGFGFKFKTKEAKKKGSVKSRLTTKALLSGARVISVAEGSNAASAGLLIGDIIFEINGKRIDSLRHKDVIKEVKAAETLVLVVHSLTQAEKDAAAQRAKDGKEDEEVEIDPSVPADPVIAEKLHNVQEDVVRAVSQKAADAAMDVEKARRTTEGALAGVSAEVEDKKIQVQEQLISNLDRKAAAAAAAEEQARLITENKMQQVSSQLLSEADRKLAAQLEHEEQERRIKSPDAVPPTTIVAHHLVEQELKQRSPEKPAAAEGQGKKKLTGSDIRVITVNRDSATTPLGLKLKSVDEQPGTYVSEIIKDGVAYQTGQFAVGDRILKINNQDVSNAAFDDVVAMLKASAKLEFAVQAESQQQQQQQQQQPQDIVAAVAASAASAVTAGSSLASSLLQDAKSAAASAIAKAPGARTVVLQRGASGLGMKIKSEDDRPGIVVNELTQGGVAQRSGQVLVNDYILQINGTPCTGLDHDSVVALLTAQDQVTLLLAASLPDAAATATAAAGQAAAEDLLSRARFTNIRTVKLERGNSGLGMKIMSQDESNGVRVCQVIEGGVAEKSGQIARGDYILTINGKPMLFADHDTVVSALKESSTVSLEIATDPAAAPIVEPTRRTVVIERDGKPLGMKVLFVTGEPGISITEITPGGLADKTQQLQLHERILSINGQEIAAPAPGKDEAAIVELFRNNNRLELVVEPSPRSLEQSAAAAAAAAATSAAAKPVAAAVEAAVSSASAAAASVVAEATEEKKKAGSKLRNLFGGSKKKSSKDDIVASASSAADSAAAAAAAAAEAATADANKMVQTLEKELQDSRETIAAQARKIQELEAQVRAAKSNATSAASSAAAGAAGAAGAAAAAAGSPSKAELVDLQVKLADAEMSRAAQQAATESLNAELKGAREEIKKLKSALEQAGISTGSPTKGPQIPVAF